MEYFFSIIAPTTEDWSVIEGCEDCTCFQTRTWYDYLQRTGNRNIVIRITTNSTNSTIGFFLGTKRWIGISTIGAPSSGMGTYTQGICSIKPIDVDTRIDIYSQLADWLKKKHLVAYIQISDWALQSITTTPPSIEDLQFDSLSQRNIQYKLRTTLFVDPRQSEQQLWEHLSYSSCKYCIHKAQRAGLHVRIVQKKEEIASFIDTHYRFVLDVSRRKHESIHMHYQKKNLMALAESLFPNNVLLIQVWGVADDGIKHTMASGIFCIGRNASSYFSGASDHNYFKYCPNELMVWEAMKILHDKDAGAIIFGGTANYKRKFGTVYATIPIMAFSSIPWLLGLRDVIKQMYVQLRKIIGRIRH